MSDVTGRSGKGLRALLWIARGTGGLYVAVLVFVIAANFFAASAEPVPEGREWLGLAMFPFGVLLAYALAFRWELIGGALAILCLFGWLVFVEFDADIIPIAAVVAIPGVLYLVYGCLVRGRSLSLQEIRDPE
jgi:hypothetical protein